MDRLMRRTLLAISLCLIFGCGSKPEPSVVRGPSSVATDNGQLTTDEVEKPVTRRILSPSDPPVMFKPTVNLSIYHLRVPLGTVSGTQKFWKRLADHAV